MRPSTAFLLGLLTLIISILMIHSNGPGEPIAIISIIGLVSGVGLIIIAIYTTIRP